MSGTIVLPIAGRSTRFPGVRPKWMLAAPDGRLMLEMSLSTVPDWRDKKLVIGALAEHLEGAGGMTAIRRALGPDPEIVIFERQTRGPAETVAEIINRARLSGPIFIKDCDSWFEPKGNVFDDVICVGDLRKMPNARNVAAKSFVGVNDSGLVTGVIEKSVSSNLISVGGYGFNEAKLFIKAYEKLGQHGYDAEPFISHVILEAMRLDTVFRAIEASDYEDVGTLAAWHAFRQRHATYFVDIDGIVLKNAGAYLPPFWEDKDQPLLSNVEVLKRLADNGAQLIFVTARPEKYRKKTEQALRDVGLTWGAIVFNVNHARRYLINDYAASNPYPSAIAVNMIRNSESLEQLLVDFIQ